MKRGALVVLLAACGGRAAGPGPRAPGTPPPVGVTDRRPVPPEAQPLFACFAALGRHDVGALAACHTPDMVIDIAGGASATGWDDYRQSQLEPMWAALPDLRAEPELVLLAGQHAVAVARVRGTNSGPIGKAPATQRPVGYWSAMLLDLDAGGRIAHETIYRDRGTVLGQLGLAHTPVRAALDAVPAWTVVSTPGAADDPARDVWDGLARHDAAAAAAPYAADALVRDTAEAADAQGTAAVQAWLAGWVKHAADLAVDRRAVLVAGDWVAATLHLSGTWRGRPLDLPALELTRVAGGRIAEHWLFYDATLLAR